MARANKLYEKPRVTTIAAGDLLTTGQLQADGTYKVKTITRANEQMQPVTYAQLEALVTASALIVGQQYLITNATEAEFNLIVSAIKNNEIGCEAKDPLYPNDKAMYNFASDVITWRWDTVNDISAGEDWRNSNNISIGTGCSKISIGSGCTVQLEGDNTNIEIGNDCDVLIPNGSIKIKILDESIFNAGASCANVSVGYGCNIVTTNGIYGTIIGNGCSITMGGAGGDINGCVFNSDASIVFDDAVTDLIANGSCDFTTTSNVYNIVATKTLVNNNLGQPRLFYLDNTNTLVNVNAEV